ncbi:LysR family transcriptional regulator [Sandaracinus amylolyticus]|uniref:LysR family transcriptional regulator n=1 Tax=Sandaracinus amylolyticus TaxID=927083 RepID=UPI001F269082|nr:LysR family transcriptional regulator [Sandaracinus amylolyticus]UJR82845.1 Hypothetical protein I5071_49100 [Sandaracinus amylolyticus]
MESLANLESFVRSAETGSFSGAARRLGLTPAAISRNVATLERHLGVRLFQRSTRKVTLTEAGERFLASIGEPLERLQSAIADTSSDRDAPSGVVKVSVSPTLGVEHVLPLLPRFRALHPAIRMDWQLSNRPVDLVAEGFDAAIGGGFELAAGVVARTLAPAHLIAVASPAYVAKHEMPDDPEGLAALEGIAMRSSRTGRLRTWTMRDERGREAVARIDPSLVLDDAGAMCRVAALGLGVALVAVPDALPYLERGALVRVLPRWWADAGNISIYYASRTLLPAKTRAFVAFVREAFARERLAERFSQSASRPRPKRKKLRT